MAFSSIGVIRTFSRGFYWVSLGFTFEIETLTVDYHVPLLYDASVNIQRCKRPCFLSVFIKHTM